MKKLGIVLGWLFHLFTFSVVVCALAFWWLAHEFRKDGPLREKILFTVERGASVGRIAELLFYQNAVADPLVFELGTRIAGAQGNLKAGEYQLQPGMSAAEIMALLKSGKTHQRTVTIPEGLTVWEIEQIIINVKDLKQARMEPMMEGSLLPETYSYTATDTWADITNRMAAAMQDTLDELWPSRAPDLPFDTKEEAVTLASIVEKETGVAAERKRIAGVFINRLRKNIPLQTDPTVIYALTGGKHDNQGRGPLGRRLLKKDLAHDSPYNTYLYPGLPPGPIANPGRAAIEAVLHPEEHDYLYFVADGTGGHVFARTLAEHNRNVAKWRKIRKEQGQ